MSLLLVLAHRERVDPGWHGVSESCQTTAVLVVTVAHVP
jgi:hypothetical protein